MTREDFLSLKPGDKVYYYRKIHIENLSTFSAVIKTLVLHNGNSKYNGGIGSMYINRTDALKQKIIDMNKSIKGMKPIYAHDIDNLKYPGPTTEALKYKFNKILQQKNIKSVVEKYPEIFI